MVMGFFSSWKIEGKYNGVQVCIYTKYKGSGKSKQKYTIFQANFDHLLGIGLKITAEGFWSRLGKKILKQEDLEAGVPSFDQRVRIQGEKDPLVQRIIQHTIVQQAIEKAFSYDKSIIIDDEGAHLDWMGIVKNEEIIKSVLECLTQVCLAIQSQQSTASV